jgi:hypothetical protein
MDMRSETELSNYIVVLNDENHQTPKWQIIAIFTRCYRVASGLGATNIFLLLLTISEFSTFALEPCGIDFLTSVGIGFVFLLNCRFLVKIGIGFGIEKKSSVSIRFFVFFGFFQKGFMMGTTLKFCSITV